MICDWSHCVVIHSIDGQNTIWPVDPCDRTRVKVKMIQVLSSLYLGRHTCEQRKHSWLSFICVARRRRRSNFFWSDATRRSRDHGVGSLLFDVSSQQLCDLRCMDMRLFVRLTGSLRFISGALYSPSPSHQNFGRLHRHEGLQVVAVSGRLYFNRLVTMLNSISIRHPDNIQIEFESGESDNLEHEDLNNLLNLFN